MKLVLFGTSGCHLCDEAQVILAANFPEVKLEVIDIAEQMQWQEQYAVKIPVLFHSASEKELFWPFSEMDIGEFIEVIKNHP